MTTKRTRMKYTLQGSNGSELFDIGRFAALGDAYHAAIAFARGEWTMLVMEGARTHYRITPAVADTLRTTTTLA